MRRIIALATTAGLLFTSGLVGAITRADAAELPDIYEVRAEAGGMHDSVAVPAYFEMFFPYSMSEASNGQTHTLAAHWYGGFFLTAAAEFYGFPPFPGTTETLYPQGPGEARVEFVPLPGGKVWEAQGRSTETTSEGFATYFTDEAGAPMRLGFGTSTSAVEVTDDGALGEAAIEMQGVDIAGGLFTIGSLVADGSVLATGRTGTAAGDATLTAVDINLAGVPLRLTPTGIELAGQGGEDGQGDLEALFAQTGITVRRLADHREVSADGTSSEVRVGGLEVVVSRPGDELEVTYTIGKLTLSSRAEHFDSGPAPTLPDVGPVVDGLDGDGGRPGVGGTGVLAGGLEPVGGVTTSGVGRLADGPGGSTVDPGGGAADLPTRTVRRVSPASTGNWSAVAALLLLVTPGGLIVRRSLRSTNG